MPYRDIEKKRAYDRAYHQKHKEEKRAYHKIWYQTNKGKCNKASVSTYSKAYYKAYYKANKESINAQNKLWKKANSDKVRAASRKRRALKRTTQVERISEKEVYLRDGGICQICHKKVYKKLKFPNPMSISLDHIIPLTEGGTHTCNNMQLAHFGCNSVKKNNILPQGEQLRIF